MTLVKVYLISLMLLTWYNLSSYQQLSFVTPNINTNNNFNNNRRLDTNQDNNANRRSSVRTMPIDYWTTPRPVGVQHSDGFGQVQEGISNSISLSILKFAHNLGLLLNQNGYANIQSECFSPISIMSALALLLLGARTNTYQEIANVFELNYNAKTFHDQFGLLLDDLHQSDNKMIESRRRPTNWRLTEARAKVRKSNKESVQLDDHILKLTNGLFLHNDYSLNLDYKTVATSIYHSDLKILNFAQHPVLSRNFINDWVFNKTYGKISNIITGDIPKSTNLILSSVLYFRGLWEQPFFETATNLDHFYPNGVGQPSKMVPMMPTGGSFPFYDAKEYGCRIIGLPYKGNLTTMYVIQPYNSSRSTLAAFQNSLTPLAIEDMISKMVQVSALVTLPKMKFTRSFNMKTLLMHMGISSIFSNSLNDLSLIGHQALNLQSQSPSQKPLDVKNRMQLPDYGIKDRYNEAPHIFTRFGEDARQSAFDSLDSLEQQRSSSDVTNNDIFVEDILHKVFMDINEVGTEAAAATVALLFRSGTDVLFRVDTPFLYLIRHDLTKLPLFYGIVNDPLLMT